MSSPSLESRDTLVPVTTALAVLKRVNLLAESSALALDIGGSLAKLLYLQPHPSSSPPPLLIHHVDSSVATALSIPVPELSGTLHFFAFETRNIHQLLRFMRTHWGPPQHILVRATGGGSYKYADIFVEEIGVHLARLDEMASAVAGLNFLLTTVKNEVYVHQNPPLRRPDAVPEKPVMQFVDTTKDPFPYLLVNIGSGVSIVKVTAHDTFERVSGSALGGGTFWGLASMLLECQSFDEVIRLTHDGDNTNVDMLVGDIYGGAYASLGLDASVIAASFGKATMSQNTHQRAPTGLWRKLQDAVMGTWGLWMDVAEALPGMGPMIKWLRGGGNTHGDMKKVVGGFKPKDVALSLLRMVSYNIGQIAYLNARVHGLDTIYFGGNFVRNHPYTIADLSFAVQFWSEGQAKAMFLKHDGYLGAIGAFIGASSADPSEFLQKHMKKRERANTSDRVDGILRVNANQSVRSLETKDMGQSPEKTTPDPTPNEDETVHTPEHQAETTNSAEGSVTNEIDSSGKPAQNEDESTRRTRSSRRKKKSKKKTGDGNHVQTSATMLSTQNLDQSQSTTDQDDSDGSWTTVTRVRRRRGAKEISSA